MNRVVIAVLSKTHQAMNDGWSLKEEFWWIILEKHLVDEVTTLIELAIVQTLQAVVCSCHDMVVSG